MGLTEDILAQAELLGPEGYDPAWDEVEWFPSLEYRGQKVVLLIDPGDRGMAMFYDREGRAITLRQWHALRDHREYPVIAFTPLDACYVSTVWIGLAMSMTSPPMIFETMAFGYAPSTDIIDARRYPTEELARAGHAQVVDELRRDAPPKEDA